MGVQERRTSAWETARDRLNWTAINAAVETLAVEKKAPDFEIETARKCIFTALERWLAEDLANCRVISVEEPFEDEFKRGFTDVVFEILSAPEDTVYQKHAGHLMGVDWKTSKNTLGSDWRDRYVYSWQGPTYVDGLARKYHRTPRLFQYRGIARSFETKPVLLGVDNPAPTGEVQSGGFRILREEVGTAQLPACLTSVPSACKSH